MRSTAKDVQSVKKRIEVTLAKTKQQVIDKLIRDLKAATPVDTGEAAAGWRQAGNKIVNDVDHISDLNMGTSRQAPAYFVEKVILEDTNTRVNGTIVTYR